MPASTAVRYQIMVSEHDLRFGGSCGSVLPVPAEAGRVSVIGGSIDASVEDREHFVDEFIGCGSNVLHSAGPEIDRSDLVDHYLSFDSDRLADGHVEWIVAVGSSNRADHRHAGAFVEKVVADNERGAPPM